VKSSLREMITHNLGLKLVSLVAAIVLFSVLRGSEDHQRSVFVDVVTTLPPSSSGKMLISEIPDQVRLTLRGGRSLVNSIRPEELTVSIDLTDTNLRYYYFADDDFDVPTGVTITQVAPTSVPLTWANRMEKRLPILPQTTGVPPEGLAVGEPARVSPNEILVIGPESELDGVRAVHTEQVDLSDVSIGRTTRLVPLVQPTPHSRFLDQSPVRVSIDVVRDLAERTLPGVPVVVDARGVEVSGVEPALVTATVRGAPTLIDLIDPATVQAVAPVRVDANSPPTAPLTVRVGLRGLSQEIEVVRVDPEEVEVRVATPDE